MAAELFRRGPHRTTAAWAREGSAAPAALALLIATATATAVFLTHSEAIAAEPPAHSRSELLKQAAAALEKGRHLEALQAWRAAYSIQAEHGLACDIGRAEAEHGSPLQATEFLALCLQLASPEPPPFLKARLPKLQELFNAARKQVGSLVIAVREPGAAVSVDGKSVGKAPVREVFVEGGPRSHRITVELPGYKREEVSVTVGKGEQRTIPIALTRVTAATMTAATTAKPPASPPAALPVVERERWLGLATAPFVGGGAVFLIGIGAGVGFAVASNAKEQERIAAVPGVRFDLEGNCKAGNTMESCLRYQEAETDRQLFRNLAIAGFISAGVAAAATVAYGMVTRSPSKARVAADGSAVVVQW